MRTKDGFSRPVPKYGQVVSEPAFGLFIVHLPLRNTFVIMERINRPNGNNAFRRVIVFGAQYHADRRSAEKSAALYLSGRAQP